MFSGSRIIAYVFTGRGMSAWVAILGTWGAFFPFAGEIGRAWSGQAAPFRATVFGRAFGVRAGAGIVGENNIVGTALIAVFNLSCY